MHACIQKMQTGEDSVMVAKEEITGEDVDSAATLSCILLQNYVEH